MIPLAFVGGIQIVNRQVDAVVLGSLATKGELGIYRAALRFSLLSPLINLAIFSVVGPHLSRLYARREGSQLQRLVTLTARFMVVIKLPLTICYLIVPAWLLSTAYGQEFGQGSDALRILAVGGFFNAVMGATVMLMKMTGREKMLAKMIGFTAVVNLVLNILLVPIFGMLGSAVATTSSSFVLSLLLAVYIRRRMGLWTPPLGSRWANLNRLFD